MQRLTEFCLAVLTAIALVAVGGAGSASATELTCKELNGTKVLCLLGTEVLAEAEQSLTLHSPIGDTECTSSTVKGIVSRTGGSSETAAVALESFSLGGCNATTVVLKSGELIFHTTEANANNDATLTWTGMEFTTTISGFHCIFSTSESDVGDFPGSTTTGGTPTLDIHARIPRTGGKSGAFCGSTAEWTGAFKFTRSDWMDVD